MTYGAILGEGDIEVVALHDSDIVTYDRSMLARLCYPVTNPTWGTCSPRATTRASGATGCTAA